MQFCQVREAVIRRGEEAARRRAGATRTVPKAKNKQCGEGEEERAQDGAAVWR